MVFSKCKHYVRTDCYPLLSPAHFCSAEVLGQLNAFVYLQLLADFSLSFTSQIDALGFKTRSPYYKK